MEQTRESLEKILKIHMDKLKQKLGLKFPADSYVALLSDSISADVVMHQGENVSVKIRTDIFVDALNAAINRRAFNNKVRTQAEIDFDNIIESTLRVIPRMFNTLAHPSVAPALRYDNETKKFKKHKETEAHPYEREVHFTIDYRCTAIHWKSGTVVREFGKNNESARDNARNKILKLLQDDSVYQRDKAEFQLIEPHEDIIFDLVLDAKVLNQDEVKELIRKLEESYL